MATKKNTRTSRSTAEVKSEFNEVKAAVKSREATPAKEQEVQKARNTAVKAAVEGLTVEKVVQKVTTTGLDIQKALASVSEELTASVSELTTVQEAIKLAKEELTTLHGVDVAKTSLEALIAEYETEEKELTAGIEALKAKWIEDRNAHDKAESERLSELNKARTREEDLFRYNRDQSRQKNADAWETDRSAKVKEFQAKGEAQEKVWAERESSLTGKETYLKDLEKQVAEFPETLKKGEARAEAIVKNTVTKHYETELTLLRKDSDSAKALSIQEIGTLKSQNSALIAQLATAHSDLMKAQEQVKNIAEKALESASGARALAEVTSMQSRENNGTGRNKQ